MFSHFFNFVRFYTILDEQPESPLLTSQRAHKAESNRPDFQMLLTCLEPDLEGNTSKRWDNISAVFFMAQACSKKIFYRIYFYLCVSVWALILLMATGTILVVRWDQDCSSSCQCSNYIENSEFTPRAVTETKRTCSHLNCSGSQSLRTEIQPFSMQNNYMHNLCLRNGVFCSSCMYSCV